MRSGEQLNKRIQLKLHYFNKNTFKSKVTVPDSKTGPVNWAKDVDVMMIGISFLK